ncbi:MAG: methylthioribose-1-phosphate isomerase [Candidatus Kentron sp. G]|nr:MAG: methylthioribose-1-phosphate isomerase [Candidatus Kentron sp. G]VFN05428.1 MAG: methylthioribose-1-phosphate isomerase [Candidatus Kentron sp. G]VFN06690.1 MAG: methylthioribose-1-phosphate isomerase [Candidatus Kentron sp. G]
MSDHSNNTNRNSAIDAIWWNRAGLNLLDQRILPARRETVVCTTTEQTVAAIRDMVVRGAPAIGITAAYGVVLAARECYRADPGLWKEKIREDIARLGASRPTAVNLVWALERMSSLMAPIDGDPEPVLLDEAKRIHEEDIAANLEMGRLGAALIEERCAVLTHCNAGALATGGYGTSLGVIRSAFAQGKIETVYADETRPWLQGARLTAWELMQDGIPVQIIADNAAALAMTLTVEGATRKKVAWAIVGSDRIAANGDVANKIGTYSVAINARYHGVRFMVVAPTSTIDMNIPNGSAIPIEVRPEQEVLSLAGNDIAPPGAVAWNPVFDVTPAGLVDALVTERGVVLKPDREKIAALMA